MEREVDGGVPFLDTKIIRNNNKIILEWYQKPTASGRYVNFGSDHSTKIKINFVKEMKKRILKISHPTFVNNNLYQLKTLLLQNSCPKGLVNKILYSTSDFSPHGGTPQIPTNNSVVNDSTLRDDVDGDVTQ